MRRCGAVRGAEILGLFKRPRLRMFWVFFPFMTKQTFRSYFQDRVIEESVNMQTHNFAGIPYLSKENMTKQLVLLLLFFFFFIINNHFNGTPGKLCAHVEIFPS